MQKSCNRYTENSYYIFIKNKLLGVFFFKILENNTTLNFRKLFSNDFTMCNIFSEKFHKLPLKKISYRWVSEAPPPAFLNGQTFFNVRKALVVFPLT